MQMAFELETSQHRYLTGIRIPQVLDFQTFVGQQRTLARNTRSLQPLGSRTLEYDGWEQDAKKKA
jgi:hypothetical protein